MPLRMRIVDINRFLFSGNSVMDKLITYVNAIHDLPSQVSIIGQTIETESWLDQGFEVKKEQTEYVFNNGVVIRRLIEQDQFPAELACAECFIRYEVVSSAPSLSVRPARKNFNNTCRESFWMKYHS